MELEPSLKERACDIYYGFNNLIKYEDRMTEEETNYLWVVVDGFFGEHINNILDCRGSLQFIIDNGIEQIEQYIIKYEGILQNLKTKFHLIGE